MKRFLLTSRVLGSILKYLKPNQMSYLSSDRCLKLAALRCLRSILTLKDEFYHRHIVQQDLFRPVFEAFRDNPVGDNLVSSAIIGENLYQDFEASSPPC
jgi:protein phosphatase-4 regulatory subunit 3